MGHEIRLSAPWDRHGVFEPVVLALTQDQGQHLYDISFDLYGKGLSTIQISEMTQKIYGLHYSSSSISWITIFFYAEMEAWRNRGLEEKYLAVYIDAIHVKVRRETISSEAFISFWTKKDYKREA
jgi:transposase-like protein